MRRKERSVLIASFQGKEPHGIKWMVRPQEKKKEVSHMFKIINFEVTQTCVQSARSFLCEPCTLF